MTGKEIQLKQIGRGKAFHVLYLGELDIYFSYETPVAFNKGFEKPVVRENIWGPTTGRHLNEISDDKASRLPSETFLKALEQEIAAISTKMALEQLKPEDVDIQELIREVRQDL